MAPGQAAPQSWPRKWAAFLRPPARQRKARPFTQARSNSLSLVRFDTNSGSGMRRVLTTRSPWTAVAEPKLVIDDRLITGHHCHRGRERPLFDPIHSDTIHVILQDGGKKRGVVRADFVTQQ